MAATIVLSSTIRGTGTAETEELWKILFGKPTHIKPTGHRGGTPR